MESGDETDKKPNARTPKSTRKNPKKTPGKGAEMLVVSEDADALPNILDNPSMSSEEEQIPTDSRSSPGPSGLHMATSSNVPFIYVEGASSPLKRKANPSRDSSPTPSKRQRT